MPADHTDLQLAMRARLLTLVVATTGSTTLSSNALGFARASGSFITNGFAVGMEVVSAGFGTVTSAVITKVTALQLYATRFVVEYDTNGTRKPVAYPPMASAAAAAARTVSAVLPSLRAWENVGFAPETGLPYIEEQYIPGPEFIENDDEQGSQELRPMYSPRIYVPDGTGISADGKYADAIRRHYSPGTLMVSTDGARVQVRGDVAPFRGQRLPSTTPGWSCIPITIPCRVRTIAVAAA